MAYYNIDSVHGNELTAGVSEFEIEAMAQRMANELGEPVYYYEGGTAGEEEVESIEVVPETAADDSELVLCVSSDGWSLHAPGSTDEQIASGEAPYLVSGTGEPSDADYERAWGVLASREVAS